MSIEELQKKAAQIRLKAFESIFRAGSGFLGGSMSLVEILVALYYGDFNGKPLLNFNIENPNWDAQDYLILSKGHAAPAWYAVLADLGFFDQSELDFYRKPGALLQARPSAKIPGVSVSTPSPGLGLAQAIGLAASLKADRKSNRTFVIAGDGELQNGRFWEAAMAAAHYKLNDLILFIDDNKQQEAGLVRKQMEIMPIQGKLENFGWQVLQVRDGHDFEHLFDAIHRGFRALAKPVCIWTHTVKGRDIKFAEGKPGYHRSILSEHEFANIKPKLEAIWKG